MDRLVLVDKDDDIWNAEGEGVRALKRKRKQEAPLVTIESEGIESIKLLEF